MPFNNCHNHSRYIMCLAHTFVFTLKVSKRIIPLWGPMSIIAIPISFLYPVNSKSPDFLILNYYSFLNHFYDCQIYALWLCLTVRIRLLFPHITNNVVLRDYHLHHILRSPRSKHTRIFVTIFRSAKNSEMGYLGFWLFIFLIGGQLPLGIIAFSSTLSKPSHGFWHVMVFGILWYGVWFLHQGDFPGQSEAIMTQQSYLFWIVPRWEIMIIWIPPWVLWWKKTGM